LVVPHGDCWVQVLVLIPTLTMNVLSVGCNSGTHN